MIKIEQYVKSKQGNSQNINKKIANTVINNIEGAQFEPHYLWGQYFDDTQDIKGDLKDVGNITAKGDISSNSVTANNVTANEKVIAKSVEAEDGKINNISSTNISTDKLTVKDQIEAEKAVINELLSGKISVEELKVTKQAHFFKLIIDEMKSVGGTQIITPTNCKLDKVIKLPNGDYKCCWKTSDGNKTIVNQWLKQDQAICMTFNVANGTSYNTQNKYYWRLVNEVGTTNIVGVDYHYIVLSDTVKDGDSIPTVGDEISQLGYRGTDDKDRQSAIIISAYKTPDTTVEAPSFVQYKGIDDFNLTKHQYNVIAANGNKFRGDFRIQTGDSIDEYINKKTEENKPLYTHIRYSNTDYTEIGGKPRNLFIQNNKDNKIQVRALNKVSDIYYFGFFRVKNLVNVGDIVTISYDVKWSNLKFNEQKPYYAWICGPGNVTNFSRPFPFKSNVGKSKAKGFEINKDNNKTEGKQHISYSYKLDETDLKNIVYKVQVICDYLEMDIEINNFQITKTTNEQPYVKSPENLNIYNLNDITTDPKRKYIGICMTESKEAPTDVFQYKWSRFKGEDGEHYNLIDVNSYVIVDVDKKITGNIKVGVLKSINEAATLLPSKELYSYTVKLRYNTQKTSTINVPLQNSGYFETTINDTYNNQQSVILELLKNNKVIDYLTIPVAFKKDAVFDVNKKLNKITATVQDNVKKVNQNINRISQVELTANGLKSTVTKSVLGVNVIGGTSSGNDWNGYKTINSNPAFIFDKQLVSPLFPDVEGKYTVSFGTWVASDKSKVRIKIYQYDKEPHQKDYNFPIDDSLKIVDKAISELPVNTELNRIYLTFSETKGSARTFRIVFESSVKDAYIGQLMVEDGDKVHQYNNIYYVLESQIKQTSEEIELKVGKAGINLKDGQITLDADHTTINGNLQLKNSSDGFTLYNQKGSPSVEIKADNIGDTTVTTYRVDTQITANCIIDKEAYHPNNDTLLFFPVETYHQTNIKATRGETVDFKAFNLKFYNYEQLVKFYNERSQCHIRLFKADGTFVKVIYTLNLAQDYSQIYFSYTFKEDGEYKLDFLLTGYLSEGRLRTPQGTYINTNVSPPYVLWKMDCDYTITRKVKDDQCFTKIANNGYFSKLGTKGSVIFNKDSITFKWGDNGIKLSDNGIQYFGININNGNSKYVQKKRDIHTIKSSECITQESGNTIFYWVVQTDDYIIVPQNVKKSGNLTINFDESQEIDGREIYIKSLADNCFVCFRAGIIFRNNSIIENKNYQPIYLGRIEHKFVFSADLNCWIESMSA